jgi:hypothetical protein
MAQHKGTIMKLCTLISLLFLATAVSAYGGAPPVPAQTPTLPVTGATISGQVMITGNTPMVNGMVLLFSKSMGPPPSKDKYWRVPDLISPTGVDGKFSLDVPEGTYYLQVTQKNPESETGPPKDSELFYFHADAEGNPRPLIITPGTRLNLGVLTGAYLFTPDMIQRDKGITAVEGVVSDMEGKPVERALVFAHLSRAATGRPVFVSDRTDKNGRYLLRLHDGGSFYLKVRSVIGGGAPQEGEFLNTTEEFEPVMVTLKKEQKLYGVTLKVKKFSRKTRDGTKKPETILKKK